MIRLFRFACMSPPEGQLLDCSYTTLPQCNASASARAAQCANPYYAGTTGPQGATGVTAEPIKLRSHLVALRATKITASDPPSTWWPGER